MGERICSVNGCDRSVRSRGWCDMHYQRWRAYGDPGEAEARKNNGRTAERFWSKVDTSGICWEWTAARSDGYGQFKSGPGEPAGAHRWAYQYLVGPIPVGVQLDHLCRNRACVNPDHLEPVSQRENILRGYGGAGRTIRGLPVKIIRNPITGRYATA